MLELDDSILLKEYVEHNWSELSAEEQDALTAAWEKSPDGKLFHQLNIDTSPAHLPGSA